MKKRYRITEAARRDVYAAIAYLIDEATDDVALRFREKLLNTIELLSRWPGIGHTRADLTNGPLRFFTVLEHLVAYEIDADGIVVRAVMHGSRDVRAVLRRRRV